MLGKITDIINVTNYGRQTVYEKTWLIYDKIGVNRLYYVHGGNATLHCDGYSVSLEEGYIYLFPQSIEFDAHIDDDSFLDHTFFDFYLPIYIEKEIIKLKMGQISLIDKIMAVLIELAERYPKHEKTAKQDDFYQMVMTNVAELMFLVSKEVKEIGFINDTRILNVLSYIQRNIHKPITTKELSDYLGIHKAYFERLFRKHMNTSPHQYIRNYRLNTAVNLIRIGYKVSEAAAAVGYESVGSFTNAIKKYTGHIPSNIKNM